MLGPSKGRGEGDGRAPNPRCVGHQRAHAARGSNFLLLRQKKVTALRHEQLVAKIGLHCIKLFDGLRANGMFALRVDYELDSRLRRE